MLASTISIVTKPLVYLFVSNDGDNSHSDDDDNIDNDSMPHATLRDLVRYCLWLLECSHETGRQYAIMFFGLAFPFRSIMEIFDSNDGLRRLYNTISTLSIITDKSDSEERRRITDNDEEYMQRQRVRYTTQAIKK